MTTTSIRFAGGMDVHNIEDSCLGTLLPGFLTSIATRLKHAYLPQKIKTVEDRGGHCSTVALRSSSGDVFFGRNFDDENNACLILRVHDCDGLSSIAVVDLAYLGLNRPDLDQTGLIRRLPLLFAPYYVMDGMNRYGVAVSSMSVEPAEPPMHPGRPAITLSTLERLILDYAKDADEAIELVRSYNVHFTEAREHLMVADVSGRFRIIEFIGGEVRVTPAEDLASLHQQHRVEPIGARTGRRLPAVSNGIGRGRQAAGSGRVRGCPAGCPEHVGRLYDVDQRVQFANGRGRGDLPRPAWRGIS